MQNKDVFQEFRNAVQNATVDTKVVGYGYLPSGGTPNEYHVGPVSNITSQVQDPADYVVLMAQRLAGQFSTFKFLFWENAIKKHEVTFKPDEIASFSGNPAQIGGVQQHQQSDPMGKLFGLNQNQPGNGQPLQNGPPLAEQPTSQQIKERDQRPPKTRQEQDLIKELEDLEQRNKELRKKNRDLRDEIADLERHNSRVKLEKEEVEHKLKQEREKESYTDILRNTAKDGSLQAVLTQGINGAATIFGKGGSAAQLGGNNNNGDLLQALRGYFPANAKRIRGMIEHLSNLDTKQKVVKVFYTTLGIISNKDLIEQTYEQIGSQMKAKLEGAKNGQSPGNGEMNGQQDNDQEEQETEEEDDIYD